MGSKHRLTLFLVPSAKCLCGWAMKLSAANRGLSTAIQQNLLLDEYNDHRRRRPLTAADIKPEPDRFEPEDEEETPWYE